MLKTMKRVINTFVLILATAQLLWAKPFQCSPKATVQACKEEFNKQFQEEIMPMYLRYFTDMLKKHNEIMNAVIKELPKSEEDYIQTLKNSIDVLAKSSEEIIANEKKINMDNYKKIILRLQEAFEQFNNYVGEAPKKFTEILAKLKYQAELKALNTKFHDQMSGVFEEMHKGLKAPDLKETPAYNDVLSIIVSSKNKDVDGKLEAYASAKEILGTKLGMPFVQAIQELA